MLMLTLTKANAPVMGTTIVIVLKRPSFRHTRTYVCIGTNIYTYVYIYVRKLKRAIAIATRTDRSGTV